MRKKSYNGILTVAALTLCMLLTACNGGGESDRPGRDVSPTPTQVTTPTNSPTPTPDPNMYLSERVVLSARDGMTIRETQHLNEEGLMTDSVTEQKPGNGADDAWEVIERAEYSYTEYGARRSEKKLYSAGALVSIQTEYWEEDGSHVTSYEYYSGGVRTKMDTDRYDGSSELIETSTALYDEKGSATYAHFTEYANDKYATPRHEETMEDGRSVVRECAENRRLEATETQPALAIVTETSADGANLLLVIGSFQTELIEDVSQAYVDTADGSQILYDLAEAYDGCDRILLQFATVGAADLIRAELGVDGRYDKIVWERHLVTQNRVSTDGHGSYRLVDVYEDGTEIIRYELTMDDNYRKLREETYDSDGKVTRSVRCEYSDDGRTQASYELIRRDDGSEVTLVKRTERGEDGRTALTEQYTQEGDRIIGKKQWEYSYDERGNIVESKLTAEDGTVSVTTYENTYSKKK